MPKQILSRNRGGLDANAGAPFVRAHRRAGAPAAPRDSRSAAPSQSTPSSPRRFGVRTGRTATSSTHSSRSERERQRESRSVGAATWRRKRKVKGKRRDRTAADGVDSDRCAESLPTRTVGPDGRLVDSGLQGSPYGARGPGSGELGGVVSIVHSTSRPPFPFLPPSLCPVPFWLPASASLAPFLCILVSD